MNSHILLNDVLHDIFSASLRGGLATKQFRNYLRLVVTQQLFFFASGLLRFQS